LVPFALVARILIPWVLAVVAGWLAVGCAPTYAAPPRLIATWPSPGASLPIGQHTFELTFNRSLQPDSVWAAVWNDLDGVLLPSEVVMDPNNPRRLGVRLLEPGPGEFRLHWHAGAARTGGSADGELPFSLREEVAAQTPPRLEVSRATAESGDKLEIRGRGFGQTCTVQLTMGDDDQKLSTVETDSSGSFVAQTRVPPGVPFGLQPVHAIDSRGASASAALQVRWGGWPPLVAFTTGQPGPRSGEVTFTLSLRNRSDYVLERVRITLGTPEDAALVGAEPNARREEGGLMWELAWMDRGVAGPFRATYRVTGATATHARIAFRHRRPRACSGDECLPAFISETTSDSTPVGPLD
jgi:hypothetical protein